jgi:transcription antitermination protein NusB
VTRGASAHPPGRGSSGRRRAREVVFRVIYQSDVTGDPPGESWASVRSEERLNEDQEQLVGDVVALLAKQGGDVDATLGRVAEKWSLQRLAATDRSVLRAAVGELLARPGTPARVVLDEAIEIARRYGSEASGRFVNGVLDRVARELRPAEFGQA